MVQAKVDFLHLYFQRSGLHSSQGFLIRGAGPPQSDKIMEHCRK